MKSRWFLEWLRKFIGVNSLEVDCDEEIFYFWIAEYSTLIFPTWDSTELCSLYIFLFECKPGGSILWPCTIDKDNDTVLAVLGDNCPMHQRSMHQRPAFFPFIKEMKERK